MRSSTSSRVQQLSLGAMFTALSVIALYFAATLPSGKWALFFVSSIFSVPLLVEDKIGFALVQFVATSALALLFVPNLAMVLPYVFLFGHYGIGKYFLEKTCKVKWQAFIWKLLYYNIGMVAIYFICFPLIAGRFLSGMALPWLILIAQGVFVIFDYLYSKVTLLYTVSIRKVLLRR